jgi:hypothetical protein
MEAQCAANKEQLAKFGIVPFAGANLSALNRVNAAMDDSANTRFWAVQWSSEASSSTLLIAQTGNAHARSCWRQGVE